MKILNIKTKNREKGNIGEDCAVKFLKNQGYKILKRNYVALDKEIDIIAENSDTLAFIEVKARTVGNGFEARPASSVTPEKQRKIITAVKYYLGTQSTEKYIGLDIIEVYIGGDGKVKEIQHLKDAYNLNSARGLK